MIKRRGWVGREWKSNFSNIPRRTGICKTYVLFVGIPVEYFPFLPTLTERTRTLLPDCFIGNSAPLVSNICNRFRKFIPIAAPTPIQTRRIHVYTRVNIRGEDSRFAFNWTAKLKVSQEKLCFVYMRNCLFSIEYVLLKCFRARPLPTPPTPPLLPLPHSTIRCQPFSFFDENTGFFPLLFFFEFKTHSKERLNDQKFNFSSNIIEGCLFGEASYTCARVHIHRTYTHKRAILI